MPADNDRHSDALVVFGLTGDLGQRKLLPALYELHSARCFEGPVVGVGRRPHDVDDLRRELAASVNPSTAERYGVDPDRAAAAIDLRFVGGDAADESTWESIANTIDGTNNPTVYAALPPDLLADVATGLADSSLPDTTRLVVEKPFGHDAESARRLYDDITGRLGDDRLLIVDHFLAKASVEHMSTFRFDNPLIDAAIDPERLESVEITLAESAGIDDRGSFYEEVGVVADVVQNHLLQTLALALMDRPATRGAGSTRAARDGLLKAVRPIEQANSVLGQYDGYRQTDGVDDNSRVATYLDAVLYVDHERWTGVPIRLRTGKRLEDDEFTVAYVVRNDHRSTSTTPPNIVRFVHGDDERIELDVVVTDPHSAATARHTLCLDVPGHHRPLGDYATMIAGALAGDRHHFASIDGVIEGWRIVAQLTGDDQVVHPYAQGSAGPAAEPHVRTFGQ